MNKKSLLWISLSPLAVLPPALIVACGNNTSTNDKPGDNPGDNPGSQPTTGQQTTAKATVTAQNLGFTGTVSEAKSTIDANWILTNKDKLLDGGINLFTSADDLVTDSVMFNPDTTDNQMTTGILSFSLKASKSFGSDLKPTNQSTQFTVKITNFIKPTSMDLEKAKNKYLQYLDGLKYDFHQQKASAFKTNEFKFGTSNNFGFKSELQLDTDNGSSSNDEAGQVFLKITLSRGTETETFKHTISGFKTTAQDNAEKTDKNLEPESMFNESFSNIQPSGIIKVKTKKADADWKNIKTKDALLDLISINPKTNLQQDQTDENAILQKPLPEGYELQFIEGSIKPNASWSKTFNEIQAGVQLVKKDGTAASGIYKLFVDGFTENKTKDVLEEWADFFEVGESPIKTAENEYLDVQASNITDAATLQTYLYSQTDTSFKSDLLDRGLTFELDTATNPTDPDDKAGSLKAKFIFKWKNATDDQIKVEKMITLYGFKVN